MSVTIGEFEVVSEPTVAPAAAAATPSTAPAAPDPLTVLRLVEQLQEQALRLWAH
jgi:hypothetical protein